MKVRLVKSEWNRVDCDALIIPLFEDEDLKSGYPAELDKTLGGLLSELKDTEEWKSRTGEIVVLYRPSGLKAARLILIGAGKREKYDSSAIRNLSLQAVLKVKSYNLKRVAVYRRSGINPELAAQAAVEGVHLGIYGPDEYKTEDKRKDFLEEVLFVTNEELDFSRVEEAMRRGEILGQATNFARRLVNEPGNRFNPSRLAETAREVAEKYGLQFEVWEEPQMAEREMGGVLAVAQGSDEPARFIILRHFGSRSAEDSPVVFIGKGVTFDSGGLSLKPAQAMEEMKADKAGACAVLAAMQAIAQLQVPKNVIGLMPAVENLPSGRALRPGDVIRSMSGKTIEVINTDAEGRLILADALHYARRLNPSCVVDLATLTGACVIALGHVRAGLFGNDDALCQKLLSASERAGEKLWRLPLDDEYGREIDSLIADVKNVGSRWGGAITAAKFLQKFAGDTPWCHIDMAGVDLFLDKQSSMGPTGFGVRTLVELLAE